jgi:integrase
MARQGVALMVVQPEVAQVPAQAGTDAHLIELWLHGKPGHTRRAYWADAEAFLTFVGKPLPDVTVCDVIAFAEASQVGRAPASAARRIGAAKSLLGYGLRLGYLRFNVGAAVKAPKLREALAERILAEADVHRMLALESDARNHALLRLVYLLGLRISEAAGLRWRDLSAREEGGQITVFGKGGKTRAIVLPAAAWRELIALRGSAEGVPLGQGRPSRRVAGSSHRQGGRGAGGAGAGRLGALAAPRPCVARARSRRTDPSGASHPGARERRHHRPLSARSAAGQQQPVSGGISNPRGDLPALDSTGQLRPP